MGQTSEEFSESQKSFNKTTAIPQGRGSYPKMSQGNIYVRDAEKRGRRFSEFYRKQPFGMVKLSKTLVHCGETIATLCDSQQKDIRGNT